MNTIETNLRSVANASKDMMDTIEKVRGVPYAAAVRGMLMCSSIARIALIISDEDTPEDAIPHLVQAISHNLTSITSLLMEHTGIDSEELVKSVIKDVESISNSVDMLGQQAIAAGKQGKPFGGE